MSKKIGILTWHYYPNFGSALQTYALQETIKSMGYRVKILNYRNIRWGKVIPIKNWTKFLFHKICVTFSVRSSRFFYPYIYFQKYYLKETRVIQKEQRLEYLCKNYKAVVCGSDQIWAPNVFNPIYMLDFVPKNVDKISYAASIGLDSIPNQLIEKYKHLLSDFKAISVREDVGARLLKDSCEINAEVVLDPTLLINVFVWHKLEKRPRNVSNTRFLFCYFLNPNHKYKESVKQYAIQHNLNIVGYSANNEDALWMDNKLSNIGPCEFLWLINNSECIITDSYHGTIFSLLYHKRFLVFERFSKDDKICQNSRIYQLEQYFSIGKQIVVCSDFTNLTIDSIDYNDFEEKLLSLKKHSNYYLKSALEA